MEKYKLLDEVKHLLISNNLRIATAESCTGGLLSSYLTDVAGSSAYVSQNFVTYSNEAKTKYLGVKEETLKEFGAVSEQTAYEMNEGLLKLADCAIATTGILGPTGGSTDKPIGLVYISLGYKGQIKVVKYISKEAHTLNRNKIKKDIVKYALSEFIIFIKNTLN